MAESILVTGKKISSMELVTNVTGSEKIPTGQPDDLALTPNQIADHTIARGDLASQEDLSQVEVSLGTQIADLESDVTSADNSIRGLIAAEEAVRIAADLGLQQGLSDETASRIAADIDLERGISVISDSLSSTVQTFTSPEAGVDPVTGVADGAYYNVRSPDDDGFLVEYQNIGGVPTPSGKSYPSTSYVQNIAEFTPMPFVQGESYNSKQLVRLDNGDVVISNIDNNTTDPNTDKANWSSFISAALSDGLAYVEWFGDTTTDATAAINMCLLYCQTNNKVAKSISGKTYPCSDTVIIPTNCDFTGSKFVFPTALSKPALEIKRMSGANQVLIENVSIKLPSITNNRTIGQIPAAGGRGVKISGLRDSEVVFNSIRGFEENIEMFSDTGGIYISYNDFKFLGMVDASKVNIHINVEGGGWINECTWYRGHFARYTSDQTAFGTTCLKISKTAGGNNGPNGHVFIGCSMEGDFTRTIDYDYDPAITTSFFSANKWISCRFEAAQEFKFFGRSLYDTFISCMISPDAVFVNGVAPIMVACTRHAKFSLDGADNIGTTRSTTRSHFFESNQSSSNMAISAGIAGQLNFAVTSAGAVNVFSPSDATKLWGIAKLYSRFGVPALAFGDGRSDANESLYRNNVGDWRIEASLSPTTEQTGTRDLGYANAAWRTLNAVRVQLSGGIGAFGTTPPTTKRSITGKKVPTTIAEQNAVLDSIVSALAAYGLVSDDRTV